MRKVAIDNVDPEPYDSALHSDRRELTGPLNTSNVAISRYALEPGERFSGSLHTHMDQEEVFLVVAGTATFETTASDGSDSGDTPTDIEVHAGEAIRFAPGEFQTGRNAGDEPVVAFALGAPRDSDVVRISRIPVLDDTDVSCPECGRGDMQIARDGDADFVCPDCGGTLDVA